MKSEAIVGAASGKVEIREIEIGNLGEWDVMVELETSSISVGTDSYILAHYDDYEGPFVTGYAPIGRIVDVGDKAAGAHVPGQRISYFRPRSPEDARQLCGANQRIAFVNVDPDDRDLLGPDCYVVKVPEALSSERAAFGGIAAVSCMGVSMAEQQVGDRVLVIGQGMIGQFAAQHFHLRGAEVAVADLHEKRLTLARATGADFIVDCTKNDMSEAVKSLWPDGADIIADSTGNYDVIEASMMNLRGRGTYVFLAWCKGADFNLHMLQAGRAHRAYFPWTLEGQRVLSAWRLMATGALKIDPLITHRFHYRDAQDAYNLIYSAPETHVGILLNWGDR